MNTCYISIDSTICDFLDLEFVEGSKGSDADLRLAYTCLQLDLWGVITRRETRRVAWIAEHLGAVEVGKAEEAGCSARGRRAVGGSLWANSATLERGGWLKTILTGGAAA